MKSVFYLRFAGMIALAALILSILLGGIGWMTARY
jgi:hypothetical protein